jgi:hypothetical protein
MLLSLVIIAKAGHDLLSHDHGSVAHDHQGGVEHCAECAAILGGRRKQVPLLAVHCDVVAPVLLNAKLTVIRAAEPLPQGGQPHVTVAALADPVCEVGSPRAPPSAAILSSDEVSARSPHLGSASPRAPPST